MSQAPFIRNSAACWRNLTQNTRCRPTRTQRRSLALHVSPKPSPKLALPAEIPQQFWSQIPYRLRPNREKREITVHPQIPSSFSKCPEPLKVIDTAEQYKLDPTGARSRLFSRANPERAGAGDILLVTFRTGEPFSGVCLSVRHRGPSTSILLRNTVTRVGTEMLVKVFSPLVQSIEVAQRAVKRPRRARLFYLRKPEKDMGSVQKIVDGYVRQRASLVGGKTQSTGGKQTQGKRGKASKR